MMKLTMVGLIQRHLQVKIEFILFLQFIRLQPRENTQSIFQLSGRQLGLLLLELPH